MCYHAAMKTLYVAVLLLIASGCLAQTADKQFWTVTAFSAAATGADAFTTVTRVGHTETCPFEVWGATLYGAKPRAMRTSLVMGGLFVASTALSYTLKRHHVGIHKFPLWAAPEGYLAYGHTLGAIHNVQRCH